MADDLLFIKQNFRPFEKERKLGTLSRKVLLDETLKRRIAKEHAELDFQDIPGTSINDGSIEVDSHRHSTSSANESVSRPSEEHTDGLIMEVQFPLEENQTGFLQLANQEPPDLLVHSAIRKVSRNKVLPLILKHESLQSNNLLSCPDQAEVYESPLDGILDFYCMPNSSKQIGYICDISDSERIADSLELSLIGPPTVVQRVKHSQNLASPPNSQLSLSQLSDE